jgi:hypothetical protein
MDTLDARFALVGDNDNNNFCGDFLVESVMFASMVIVFGCGDDTVGESNFDDK